MSRALRDYCRICWSRRIWRNCAALDLSDQFFDLLVFEVLIESSHFPRLQNLDLSGTSVCSDEGFDLLASAEQLQGLTALSLSGRRNDFDPSRARHSQQARHQRRGDGGSG